MTQRIPKTPCSTGEPRPYHGQHPATPRPNEDDDDEDEDSDIELDDEPAVIREPDEAD